MIVTGHGAAAPRTRAARPEDSPAIAKALLESAQFDGVLSEGDLADIVQRAQAAMDDDQRTVLVAELAGTIVGYAQVHWVPALFLPGPEGYVTELFVQVPLAAVDAAARC